MLCKICLQFISSVPTWSNSCLKFKFKTRESISLEPAKILIYNWSLLFWTHITKGHSLCKQCLHDLQFMKKGYSSSNLSKLARTDISCQFMKRRSLCRTVYKMNSNVSTVVEFLRWWVLKSKIFDVKNQLNFFKKKSLRISI